jgi:hypothetical protein
MDGPLQVAEVEVDGESVPEILGGEVLQWRPGHGSSDRAAIVSLIIDSLQELPPVHASRPVGGIARRAGCCLPRGTLAGR